MRKPRDNSAALAAFIARKPEIDTILARLTALSAEHFNRTPNAVNWSDVGTIGSYLECLQQVATLRSARANTRPESPHASTPRSGSSCRGSGR
jgi:hypothetical protein